MVMDANLEDAGVCVGCVEFHMPQRVGTSNRETVTHTRKRQPPACRYWAKWGARWFGRLVTLWGIPGEGPLGKERTGEKSEDQPSERKPFFDFLASWHLAKPCGRVGGWESKPSVRFWILVRGLVVHQSVVVQTEKTQNSSSPKDLLLRVRRRDLDASQQEFAPECASHGASWFASCTPQWVKCLCCCRVMLFAYFPPSAVRFWVSLWQASVHLPDSQLRAVHHVHFVLGRPGIGGENRMLTSLTKVHPRKFLLEDAIMMPLAVIFCVLSRQCSPSSRTAQHLGCCHRVPDRRQNVSSPLVVSDIVWPTWIGERGVTPLVGERMEIPVKWK
ncbi:hypothetical protein B0T20DRAFT_417536 [Sordaria brevicollis]|uniref:Uncharacterized protein n=1 Tax=Sordaria brevicollis TaxID=83679 RepID=A0AAE0U9Y0_SORBR|nr:hypothetical protein B0T20DRAFT_417536 [Sordaria brevicollis]